METDKRRFTTGSVNVPGLAFTNGDLICHVGRVTPGTSGGGAHWQLISPPRHAVCTLPNMGACCQLSSTPAAAATHSPASGCTCSWPAE